MRKRCEECEALMVKAYIRRGGAYASMKPVGHFCYQCGHFEKLIIQEEPSSVPVL